VCVCVGGGDGVGVSVGGGVEVAGGMQISSKRKTGGATPLLVVPAPQAHPSTWPEYTAWLLAPIAA
jgi:hypothetical protein